MRIWLYAYEISFTSQELDDIVASLSYCGESCKYSSLSTHESCLLDHTVVSAESVSACNLEI
jgi:hypothetical protein